VAKRIDGERGVIKNHGADEKADDQAHPGVAEPEMTDKEAERSGGDRRDEDPLVEPDQFRILVQVTHDIGVIFLVFLGKDPADVRPVEAFELGRVDVQFRIRMLVVMAMMGGPPECALLGRGAAEKREEN